MPVDPSNLGRTPNMLKVEVPAKIAKGLAEAAAQLASAKERRDKLILESLALGCSLRDIAAAADLTHGRVAQIGKQHGWPPPEVTEARARAIADLKDWRRRTIGE